MLAHLVPAPLVRVFARPYVAGGEMQAALDTAGALLAERRVVSTLDVLGEDVKRPEQVLHNEATYTRLIRAVAEDPRFAKKAERPTVSLKPSAFSIEADKKKAFEPIRRIVERAQAHDVAITVDMEDHRWTDVTLEQSVALFEEGFDVGTVMQTRLHRTEADLQRIPPKMRIRMVIGIYPEPAEVAITDKAAMKTRMLAYSEALMARGVYVEFATHDDACVESFVRDVATKYPDLSEVQMLLGVPRTALQGRVMEGAIGAALPVRLYVPFALGWDDATAYLRRRMAESPSMALLVLRNLLRRER